MTPLHRHQIAWLTQAGWDRIRSRSWDAMASECLGALGRTSPAPRRHKAAAVRWRLRHHCDGAAGAPSAGTAGVLRLAFLAVTCCTSTSSRRSSRSRGCCPARRAGHGSGSVPACAPSASSPACYGSYGWKYFSQLDHVRTELRHRRLDCRVGPEQADAAAAMLQSFAASGPGWMASWSSTAAPRWHGASGSPGAPAARGAAGQADRRQLCSRTALRARATAKWADMTRPRPSLCARARMRARPRRRPSAAQRRSRCTTSSLLSPKPGS
jgi:phosphoribosyl-dephospho-CoA transferase